jgi:hypothetical protein
MRISEIEQLYKDEWVLVDVLKYDTLGRPVEGNVIAHSKNRDETYSIMKSTKSKDIAHFYTGKIPEKGYAVVFNG